MKDKQVIDQLRLLQFVQPDKKTLQLIRNQIPSQIPARKDFGFKKWLTITPRIPLIAFALIIVFLLVVISFFPYVINNAVVNARIALAPNHYEKAQIAIAYIHSQLPDLKENASNKNKIILLSESVSLANTEMAGLQLIGEKGKYTSYQCEELYQSYRNDLRMILNTLRYNKSNDAKLLTSQITQYDIQVENKLQNYNKKKWKDDENK